MSLNGTYEHAHVSDLIMDVADASRNLGFPLQMHREVRGIPLQFVHEDLDSTTLIKILFCPPETWHLSELNEAGKAVAAGATIRDAWLKHGLFDKARDLFPEPHLKDVNLIIFSVGEFDLPNDAPIMKAAKDAGVEVMHVKYFEEMAPRLAEFMKKRPILEESQRQ